MRVALLIFAVFCAVHSAAQIRMPAQPFLGLWQASEFSIGRQELYNTVRPSGYFSSVTLTVMLEDDAGAPVPDIHAFALSRNLGDYQPVEAIWNGERYELYLHDLRPDELIKVRLTLDHATLHQKLIVRSQILSARGIEVTTLSTVTVKTTTVINDVGN